MTRSLFGILIASSTFWAGLLPAVSADEEPYVVEYQASRAALDSGDPEAAARHALRAWQSAEQLRGDDRLTAILAYNYGHLVLYSDPKSADRAMSRAVELQQAGVGDLNGSDLTLYAAYADFKAHEFHAARAEQLRNALELREAGGNQSERVEHIPIWLELASGYLEQKHFEDAVESADSAETLIRRAMPEDWRPLAQASLVGGVARLARRPRPVEQIQQAHNALVRARQLFPPQKSIEDFDPMLAEILAWSAVADSTLYWSGEEDYPDHEDLDAGLPHSLPHLLIEGGDASLCGIPELPDWDRSGIPAHKLRSLYTNKFDGYIGGLVVGLHVTEDLTITDVRVLAEVPRKVFSEYVAKGIEGQQLPAAASTDCSGDLIKAFRTGMRFNADIYVVGPP